jgi:histidine triad (HIT) family protein
MQRTVFNDIVEGKIPAHTVYEDDRYLAFLDIFPRAKGHTLVIPKTHYVWTYDVPEFGEYWETARKVAGAIERSLQPKWMNFFTHGLIPYAHIHIIPRYDEMSAGQEVAPPVMTIPKEEFPELAERIRAGF